MTLWYFKTYIISWWSRRDLGIKLASRRESCYNHTVTHTISTSYVRRLRSRLYIRQWLCRSRRGHTGSRRGLCTRWARLSRSCISTLCMIESSTHSQRVLMLMQKRKVIVTLDIDCYDDLDVYDINWKDLLQLEGAEDVHVNVKEYDPFWSSLLIRKPSIMNKAGHYTIHKWILMISSTPTTGLLYAKAQNNWSESTSLWQKRNWHKT